MASSFMRLLLADAKRLSKLLHFNDFHEWIIAAFRRNHDSPDSAVILMIDRSKPFNPAEFLGEKGWTIMWENKRSIALTEVDLNKIREVDCIWWQDMWCYSTYLSVVTRLSCRLHLKNRFTDWKIMEKKPPSITGEKKFRRLNKRYIPLDAKIFQTIIENWDKIPEPWKKKKKNTSFNIDGTILMDLYGNPYVFYFFVCDDGSMFWGHEMCDVGRYCFEPYTILAR